jgi:hypothetical protein
MAYTQEDLDLVEKHVAQGEGNVQQQRQIVTGLSESGYPTGEALELLAGLERTLHHLQQRRSRIRIAVRQQSEERMAVGGLRAISRDGVWTSDQRSAQR